MFGKMRSFQASWYEAFPFIEDSYTLGFSNWHKYVEKLRKHNECESHKSSTDSLFFPILCWKVGTKIPRPVGARHLKLYKPSYATVAK